MYGGKYSAVVGRKTRLFVCAQYEFSGYGFFQANHSAVFPPVHQTTEFRQTMVWATVVDWPLAPILWLLNLDPTS